MSLSAWLTRLISDTCSAEGITLRETSTVVEFARKPQGHGAAATALADETIPARAAPPAGATMVPTAALMPSNLGTRQSEDLPEELLADIVKRGIRQPLRLRRAASDAGRYEIICGYRRWRVAQRLGLAQLPAAICSDEDGPAVLASLVENLRQGDLSVIEEAQAYFRLLTRYAMDIAAVTKACELDRQHIVRRMRLLGLPPRLRQLIATGAISADHADLLLDATNPEGLADAIVAEHLSIETARQRLGAVRKPETSL